MATPKQRRAELIALLNVLFTLYEEDGYTIAGIAEQADLSKQTIYRLWGCTFVWPRFETIQKLAAPLNISLTLTREGVKVNLGQ